MNPSSETEYSGDGDEEASRALSQVWRIMYQEMFLPIPMTLHYESGFVDLLISAFVLDDEHKPSVKHVRIPRYLLF